jgi:hypothetical protein
MFTLPTQKLSVFHLDAKCTIIPHDLFLYINTNIYFCYFMQPSPLLLQKVHDASPTPQQTAKGLGWITIVVLLVLFGGAVGFFIYFTLPSNDPIDLGVQTHEMQQMNFCSGLCCYPRSQSPTGKTNVFQTGALVLEIAGNKDCVQCPHYWDLKMSDCPMANETVPL